MDAYGIPWNKTGADNVQQLMELLCDATTTRRFRVHSIGFAVATAANDATPIFVARRTTNSGTGTAVTPAPKDPAAPAALSDAKHLMTGDAASWAAGTQLFLQPLNGRASFRWVAVDATDELVGPATASNGIGFGVTANSTLTFGGTLDFKE
jgi:hypothetical protein